MKLTSKTKKVIKSLSVMAVMAAMFTVCTVVASAAGNAQQADAAAVGTYETVIDFILVWLRRGGALVGLFGAVILALGFKNDDPDRKTAGVWTMASGFLVCAIAAAADMFNLFA